MSTSPLEDRKQSAREAAYDAVSRSDRYYRTSAAIEASIETATRVQITDEVIGAFSVNASLYARGLRAAFEAAGFEVIE